MVVVLAVYNLRPNKIVLEGENAMATFWTARTAKAAATRFMVQFNDDDDVRYVEVYFSVS